MYNFDMKSSSFLFQFSLKVSAKRSGHNNNNNNNIIIIIIIIIADFPV